MGALGNWALPVPPTPCQDPTKWDVGWNANNHPNCNWKESPSTQVGHNVSGSFELPEASSGLSMDPWTKNETSEQLWDQVAACSQDHESLRLDRIPSLDTQRSSGSIAWDSPPEVTSIFGASHWPGISSSGSLQYGGSIANCDNSSQVTKDPESSKWDLEALCGSASGTMLNGSIITSDELATCVEDRQDFQFFPYRPITDASAQDVFDHTNFIPTRRVMNPQTDANNPGHQTLQLNADSDRTTSPYTPYGEEKSLGFDMQDSSAVIGSGSRSFQLDWDCFVMEDGSGEHVIPAHPRRRGARHGRLPPDKAKITAERRRQGKTCMRCRIARVAVSE